jgi:hypothetical protein
MYAFYGKEGTYVHYGLLKGLGGTSIGSISKDIWFYLDKLVKKFPHYFEATLIDKEGKVYPSSLQL